MSEEGASLAGLKLANAFLLTTRGVPQLYYGDELAMTGPDEPTTRGDFPGGFPGDKRNAFIESGRITEEQELFSYIRRLTRLHTELEPLGKGGLFNLYVSERQYAYARVSQTSSVVVVLNNDKEPAEIEFDVTTANFTDGTKLRDRLDASKDVIVRNGKVRVSLPKRSAAIFVRL